MELLRTVRIRSEAKRYASRLGPSLQRNFGAGPAYTPRQIQRSISDCGLDPRYIVFGYAAFLTEIEFNAHRSDMPVALPYQEARSLYSRFVRTKPGLTFGGAQVVDDQGGGGGGWGGADVPGSD